MNLQQFGVISLTLAATVYLIIQAKRKISGKVGCGKGCENGCVNNSGQGCDAGKP